MHSCPECGQACYCGGDIDDVELEGGEDDCLHCDDEAADCGIPDLEDER